MNRRFKNINNSKLRTQNSKLILWGWIPLSALFCSSALAQVSSTYLKSATLYLAVDGWADVWLNGIPIRESQPTTPEPKGFQTVQCLPKHLCYFQNDNVLAIANDNAYHNPRPLNGQIGLAYILRLRFSDGTEMALSSNDTGDQKAYYLPNREMEEPRDWQRRFFHDATWAAPFALGAAIPGVASLVDPETGQPIQFLSAAGETFKVQYEGEKHLYRREFHLDIASNPVCAPAPMDAASGRPYKVPPPTPTEIPILPQRIMLPPSFAPSPTETPLPAPVLVWKPMLMPTVTFTSWPTATWTTIPRDTSTPKPTGALGYISAWTPLSCPTPTFTTQPAIQPLLRKARRLLPTPTLIPGFETTSLADPYKMSAPAAAPTVVATTPTTAVADLPTAAKAQTVVFQKMDANIYISFADGPGIYRLEVVDNTGAHLRNLFEKRVVAEQDEWVQWDGKDDGGKDAPPGQYTVLYTKDGENINQLVLIKTAPGQEDSNGAGF